MTSLRYCILFSALLVAVAGCSDMRESLGIGRSTPDEFTVVDRPPLAMPPDFGLRPPRPGAPRPQEVDPAQTADAALFGGNAGPAPDLSASNNAAGASSAEIALLKQSGADKANPNIRTVINSEAAEKTNVSDHLLTDLLTWQKPGKQTDDTTVDASAEATRIKAAKDQNTPLNQTATPVIEREKPGFLGL